MVLALVLLLVPHLVVLLFNEKHFPDAPRQRPAVVLVLIRIAGRLVMALELALAFEEQCALKHCKNVQDSIR